MIVLIAGGTHTGKTATAQKLLETYQYPYYSLDHLKMGLIRSEQTKLTVEDDTELTPYLWNIAKEIIKTAIENKQNLIVEGCYIPFDWQKDFEQAYLKEISYHCLIMTKSYIEENFKEIKAYGNIVEQRLDDSYLTKSGMIQENETNLATCIDYQLNYILIDKHYDVSIVLEEGITC